MDSQTLDHRSADRARGALEILGVIGAALIAYIAGGVLLEAFTSVNVPFVSW